MTNEQVDVRTLSVPIISLIAFVIAFGAWGLHGNVKAWKLQTQEEFLELASHQRSAELLPLKLQLDEVLSKLAWVEVEKRQPFKKGHYEELRKMVGPEWPIYDELNSISKLNYNHE